MDEEGRFDNVLQDVNQKYERNKQIKINQFVKKALSHNFTHNIICVPIYVKLPYSEQL